MDLMQYLVLNYGYNEPIFSEYLYMKLNMKPVTLRQILKRLTDRKQLERYEDGIYYIPKPGSLLKVNSLNINKVINKKYLYNNKIIGYRSGLSFANELALTSQTATTLEIVTNKETNWRRPKKIKNFNLILSKPRVEVNDSNYKLLQVLDLLTNVEKFSEKPLDNTYEKIVSYAKTIKLNSSELESILNQYPSKTKLKAYESGLMYELTRR